MSYKLIEGRWPKQKELEADDGDVVCVVADTDLNAHPKLGHRRAVVQVAIYHRDRDEAQRLKRYVLQVVTDALSVDANEEECVVDLKELAAGDRDAVVAGGSGAVDVRPGSAGESQSSAADDGDDRDRGAPGRDPGDA